MTTTATEVKITTFGYLHGDPPEEAHLTLDLRAHFRDPHIDPALRHMTAHDAKVRLAVLFTPGIQGLVMAAAEAAAAYRSGPSTEPVAIAIGCASGRHRAAVVGIELADVLRGLWHITATVTHRDLDKPVIDRPTQAA